MSIAPAPEVHATPAADACMNAPTNGIHLWQLPALDGSSDFAEIADCLSADERERAQSFHFAEHRDAFVANRGRLRMVLSDYLGGPADGIVFGYGAQGKPALKDADHTGLCFNVSHTDGLALIAIAHNRRVGVDVEKMRPMPDLLEIARLHFSPDEYEQVRARDAGDQLTAFYDCWTRKEAFLKGLGEGLNRELGAFEVDLVSDEARAVRACTWNPELCASWFIQALRIVGMDGMDDYAAALAYEGTMPIPDSEVQTFVWPR